MKKIDPYIQSEFNLIKAELNTQLTGPFDINQKKNFLATHISKEIVFRSQALVGTLINLMMGEAIEHLEKHDISIQNKFFEADFENKIKSVTRELNIHLLLEPEEVFFSRDPRIVNGVIAGGFTFVIGSTVSVGFFKTSKVGAVLAGVSTILLSILAYGTTYNNFSDQARNKVQSDINAFLSTSEEQVKEWLYSISELFETEFNQFLNEHQIQLK